MNKQKLIFILFFLSPLFIQNSMAKGDYQQTEVFIKERLGSSEIQSKRIWLTTERQQKIKQIIGHKYPRLRLRYWQKGSGTVWILEEVGKEELITVGIHIVTGEIQQLKVLIYRETRGGEVRHPFFTQQFEQAKLVSDNMLDRQIDGITGATLSVRALKKLSILALWLASQIEVTAVSKGEPIP